LLEVGEAFDLVGASGTAPLKTRVFDRVPEIDDLSRRIGAIYTLKRVGATWEGRNFDVAGFLAPFDRRKRALDGVRAVVLGAGGAARTAVWALQSRGANVRIAARRGEQAAALAGEFSIAAEPWPPAKGWDLLVNTTPVGTWPVTDRAPLDRELVEGGAVYDLIYNPEETTLLSWAAAAGAETIGGLEMLVGQAALQFQWWTGREAPVEMMTEAARRFLIRAQGQL
jgi:shikimate dehydrogenase